MRAFIFAPIVLALSWVPSFAAAGAICGGIMGTQCGEKEWCSYAPDNACGSADGSGVCMVRPDLCTMVYLPVCGCDGNTYTNACSAHAAGASVAYVGTCRAPDEHNCAQVISCGIKDGVAKEYSTPCAAARDGATKIAPKSGAACAVTQ
ncbi:MAG: hypothetical protein ACREDX_04955 [Aestuariivirga sp.]